MAKVRKKRTTSNRVVKRKKRVSDDDIKRLLLFKTDEISTSKGLDEVLDKINEKDALIKSSKFPDLIGELQGYEPKFPLEFYRQIFRLYGWRVDSDQCLRNRPGIVAKITAYLIYLRFPIGVLKELQNLNEKDEEGVRLFKHFQRLTPEGEKRLRQYIKESVDLMSEHRNWHQFIKAFTLKYSNPYGLSWDNY